jgi:hypothetical protein
LAAFVSFVVAAFVVVALACHLALKFVAGAVRLSDEVAAAFV